MVSGAITKAPAGISRPSSIKGTSQVLKALHSKLVFMCEKGVGFETPALIA